MLGVALVGLAANASRCVLLHDAQRESLTMRGAYLEVMGDLAGSVAVIVAAIVIAATGWTPADAIASALIGAAHPPADLAPAARRASTSCSRRRRRASTSPRCGRTSSRPPGVADVHDLHAWTITSGVNVLSAHVVLGRGADPPSCSTSCAAACRATSTSSTRRSSSRPPTVAASRRRTTPEDRGHAPRGPRSAPAVTGAAVFSADALRSRHPRRGAAHGLRDQWLGRSRASIMRRSGCRRTRNCQLLDLGH